MLCYILRMFLEPKFARDEVPGEARRPPPDPDEHQGLMNFCGVLNHTNDGSPADGPSLVMEIVCHRMCLFAFSRRLLEPGGARDHIGELVLHRSRA